MSERFNVLDRDLNVVARRVSEKAALRISAGLTWPWSTVLAPMPRFSIKVARWETPNPIILKDAARPAFLGQYPTIARAALAMDNVVRRERGMPPRIDWENVGMYSRELDNAAPTVSSQAEYVEEGVSR